MIPRKIIQKIVSDERLQVPFYANLGDYLQLSQENQQYLVEIVNDTGDVSAPLFDPDCDFIYQCLNLNPLEHNQEEFRTAINAYRELYQMSYEEKSQWTSTTPTTPPSPTRWTPASSPGFMNKFFKKTLICDL